jgi:hypothetical protein
MNYFDFLLIMFITVCWIWGCEYSFKDGEILGRPGNWMRANLPEWVLKPTMDCKYCMSSVHGTAMYVLLIDPLLQPWYMWIVFVVGCCGLTYILDNK